MLVRDDETFNLKPNCNKNAADDQISNRTSAASIIALGNVKSSSDRQEWSECQKSWDATSRSQLDCMVVRSSKN